MGKTMDIIYDVKRDKSIYERSGVLFIRSFFVYNIFFTNATNMVL